MSRKIIAKLELSSVGNKESYKFDLH